jgi:hypothetical protein
MSKFAACVNYIYTLILTQSGSFNMKENLIGFLNCIEDG